MKNAGKNNWSKGQRRNYTQYRVSNEKPEKNSKKDAKKKPENRTAHEPSTAKIPANIGRNKKI